MLFPIFIFNNQDFRSTATEVFLEKGVLQLYWNVLQHWCSPVNLLHIFRIPFPNNISRGLLLRFAAEHTLNSLFLIFFMSSPGCPDSPGFVLNSVWCFAWKILNLHLIHRFSFRRSKTVYLKFCKDSLVIFSLLQQITIFCNKWNGKMVYFNVAH